MKYSVGTLSALAAVVAAQPRITNSAFNLVEGEPFTLTFEGCTSTCTIVLQNGPEGNLQDVETLTTDATDSFVVELGPRPEDEYNFLIIDNETEEENWSMKFSYGSEAPEEDTTTSVAPSSTAAPTSTVESTTVETTTAETTTSAATTETTEASTTSAESSTTLSTSATTTTSGPAETETDIPDSGAGRLASPLALVAGAIVAMAYLN
ncbi:hypothetical protein B0I35DRAFT_34224 [Stachybotrys elegans]|uniref:Yeast cell wall synthesis Kre9/Knh1-like N-terminal domain-containing protein n=1 Tax=Stachybotrys elegans TaxID=80388 RepID=A0A8K0T8C1_9HYPO|nr:hypothetical protein B0I35DRAFT_34224 [Stachybotrys elegans]